MFILASLIHSLSHGGRGLEWLPSIATQRKSLMGTANQCQGERVGLGWNVDEKQERLKKASHGCLVPGIYQLCLLGKSQNLTLLLDGLLKCSLLCFPACDTPGRRWRL